MRRASRPQSTLLAAAATCAVAVIVFVAPRSVQSTLRGAVLDVVVPSQAWVLARYESSRERVVARWEQFRSAPRAEAPTNPAKVDAQVASLQQTCRRLRLENARLRNELHLAEQYGASPVATVAGSALEAPTVVTASVIGQRASSSAARQSLSSGRSQGIGESDVVLDAALPQLDQGAEAGVEAELDVLIGRCVVGRIASVGRWSSTVEPITDPRYRGLAQIVRPSDQGGSFGAEGIVVGQGTELLKLTEVPNTQSVRVGDEVYTSDRDRRFPVPLYYGRVVRVEESGRNWDIAVRPAARVSDLKSVAVLKVGHRAGKTLAE
jgi:cell shape-determining protein MreC